MATAMGTCILVATDNVDAWTPNGVQSARIVRISNFPKVTLASLPLRPIPGNFRWPPPQGILGAGCILRLRGATPLGAKPDGCAMGRAPLAIPGARFCRPYIPGGRGPKDARRAGRLLILEHVFLVLPLTGGRGPEDAGWAGHPWPSSAPPRAAVSRRARWVAHRARARVGVMHCPQYKSRHVIPKAEFDFFWSPLRRPKDGGSPAARGGSPAAHARARASEFCIAHNAKAGM